MDPLSIIGIVGTAGKNAFEVSHALYKLAHDTKNTDQAVADLASEVETLGEACNSVQLQLQGIVSEYGAANRGGQQLARLWRSTETKLEECQITIRKLETAIESVRTSKPNVFAQVWQQTKLNLSKDDISDIRSRIRSHTTALQVSLQVINITISHLAPRQADQSLLGKLDALQRKLDEWSSQQKGEAHAGSSKKDDFFDYAVDVLSSGNSLYESSIAGGSFFGGSAFGDVIRSRKAAAQVPDWIRSVQAVGSKDSSSYYAPTDSGHGQSLPSEGDSQQWAPQQDPFEDDGDAEWDDEFEMGVAIKALQLARESFRSEDFVEANEHVQAALETIHQLSSQHRKTFDMREIKYMAAICSFYLHEPPAAETALVSFLENPGTTSPAEATQLCHVGHLLAQVYVRLGKLDLARSSCHGAVRGRWKLLGEKDLSYYESLALLARIHELQGHAQKTKMYAAMIDPSSRDSLIKMFQGLQISLESEPIIARKPVPVEIVPSVQHHQQPIFPVTPTPKVVVESMYSKDDESLYSVRPPAPISSTTSLLVTKKSTPVLRTTLSAPPATLSSSRTNLALPSAETSTPITLHRARLLQALGLTARNAVEEALVAGSTERALRLVDYYRKTAFGTKANPLHLAALFNELEVAKALIPRCNINDSCKISNAYGSKATPLLFAIVSRSTSMIRLLVDNGATITPTESKKLNSSDFRYFAPAPLARKWWLDLSGPMEPGDCIEILRTFVALGWDVNSPVDTIGRTMLHLAAQLPQEKAHLRESMTRWLIEEGADVMIRAKVLCLPLHFACRWNESSETVDLLLQRRAGDQVKAKDQFGNTPLHDAVWNRRYHGPKVSLGIINSLLVAGSKVNDWNGNGETPLSVTGDLKGTREHHVDPEAANLLQLYAR